MWSCGHCVYVCFGRARGQGYFPDTLGFFLGSDLSGSSLPPFGLSRLPQKNYVCMYVGKQDFVVYLVFFYQDNHSNKPRVCLPLEGICVGSNMSYVYWVPSVESSCWSSWIWLDVGPFMLWRKWTSSVSAHFLKEIKLNNSGCSIWYDTAWPWLILPLRLLHLLH